MPSTPSPAPADELLEHGDGLVELDSRWVIVRVNAAQERATGKPRAETLGRVFWEVWPEVADPDGAQWRAYHRCMEERVAVELQDHYAPFDVWFHITSHPTSTGGIAVTFRDVTSQKRAEQSVRAERDFSTAILDTLATLVIVLDTEARIVRFNAACERTTGYAEREVLGKSVFELLVPEADLPGTRAAFRQLRMGDFPNQHRNRWRARDGTERLLEWSNTAIADERGQIQFIIGTGVDVSERERAVEALRESEERYRSVFDSAAVGVGRVALDGRFLEVNGAYARLVGYSRDELLGLDFQTITHPDDLSTDVWQLEELLAGRTRSYRMDKRYIRKDGSTIWVSLSVGLARDAAGRPAYCSVVVEDISARKAAEEALRESGERHRTVLENMAEGLVLFDPAGDITYQNPASVRIHRRRLSGDRRRLDHLRLGWKVRRYPDGDVVPPEGWAIPRVLRGERIHNERFFVDCIEDPELNFVGIYSGAPVYDADGELAYGFLTIEEITDQARAEVALRHANGKLLDADRRKDEFLGMLSHELRNPLAPIRNALFILDHGEPDGQQARRAKDIVRRQVAHLTRLVDDLLDVTRIGRGKIELRREELDVADLVRRAAEDYRPVLQGRGLELALDVPAGPVLVNGDPARLTQVFGNLLGNAAKFTPAGGRVSVSLRTDGDRAVAHVQDTGPGIAPDVLSTLFEPFTQGKQTLARAEGGLGLGLSLVKGLVALHGGEVDVSSVAGRGADFVVRLERCRPAAAVERTSTRAAAPPAGGAARHRVLVVDDNRDAAESLGELMEMLGHEAELAYDGPSAIAEAGRMRPDLVLCDIGLPGMDGYQVARELRARHDGDLRLVALSGYAQPEDVDRALEAGFDAHVAKPPDPERLAQLLECPRHRPATDEPQPGVTPAP